MGNIHSQYQVILDYGSDEFYFELIIFGLNSISICKTVIALLVLLFASIF